MSKGKFIGAIALTLVVGVGLIFGNAAFASKAMASAPAPQAPAIESSENSAVESKEIAENTDPNGVSTVLKTLENGATVMVQYSYGENGAKAIVTHTSPDGQSEVFEYEGEAAESSIERFGGPKRNLPTSYAKGQSTTDDISQEEAIASALSELTEKYALKQGFIARFNATATFFSTYEDVSVPVWFVSLYPANAIEFSEIGSYSAVLDAKTGEAIQLLSAVDGKG
jgi:hypothetical protein